ncbi:lipopolysaccharide transport periplasmic protein LptA [Niveibacterium sp. 24ML]|uniref:lipopolysaccharide transport periplasmic protein LptA n=1 Tax=Niveibacterium sp. 24ML TaxID=2985512 RepID=UPI00226F4460|nr:lipopolysaccharide transport periplasmic protein LptA [Niveibacterium sp. 24ML]MCX9154828.1 lipopolysaccharide transport periplasmic protein LptA [Niveibacterium sp. 24ML]
MTLAAPSRQAICLALLAFTLCGGIARAERADRDKPVNVEADRVTVDDKNKVQIFEGRVKLTQGTLSILSDKVVVTQDIEGFQKGVATGGQGGLARFRQKRELKDEWVDGEAERIEYDAKTDLVQLFNRAKVRSGKDEVDGQYINYDGYNETYLVTNGPNATVEPNGESRVKVTIQPKKTAPAAKPANSTGR